MDLMLTVTKIAHSLATGQKEEMVPELLEQQRNFRGGYGEDTVGRLKFLENTDRNMTLSALERLQERTDAMQTWIERISETLRRPKSKTPNLGGTHLVSNSKQQALMLRKFSNSWWGALNTTPEETWKGTKWRQRIWLDVIEEPSPAVLVMKWFSVAILGLAIYHSHLGDRYQSYFLVLGLASAAIAAHLFSPSLMSGIQTYLPLCVTLALCWSAVIHRLARAVS